MKNLLTLLLLLACMGQACGKKNKVQWYEGPPYVKVLVDNQEKEYGYIYLSGINIDYLYELHDSDRRFNLQIGKPVNPNDPPPRLYSETFSIYFIHKQLGRQEVKGSSTTIISNYYSQEMRNVTDTTPVYSHMYNNQEGGEFTCERITVNDEVGDNWIEIQKEEGNFKRIWGKLHINMKVAAIENACPNPKYPATFKVTGDFYLEL